MLKGDDVVTLQEAANQHREIQVPFQPSGCLALCAAVLFDMPQVSGLRVWWGLHSLWGIFGVAGNACEWIANRCRWWVKKWDKIGLPIPHFRAGLKSKFEVRSSVCGIDLEIDRRCVAECSLSTAALLAFLVQSSTPRAKKHEEQCSRWRQALKCVLCDLLPECQLRLVFDKRYDPLCVEWAPESSRSVRVPIKAGCIRLEGVPDVCAQVVVFKDLFMQPSVSIIEALQSLDCAAWSWLYVQVLLQLAMAIEAKIIAGPGSGTIPTTCMPAVANTRKGANKLKLLAKALLLQKQKAVRTRVCKYFLCGRRAFDAARCISLTCDASRIGKRQCMVATIGKPDNTLMWAPPQANIDMGLASGCRCI